MSSEKQYPGILANLAVVATIVVSAGALLTSCADQPCTEFPCRNGADLMVGALTYQDSLQLYGSTITICHNDTCATGLIPDMPAEPEGFTMVQLHDDVHTTAGVGIMGFMGAILVVGSFTGPKNLWHDGDRFSGEVIMPDGATLLSNAWHARFIAAHPNGEECGPACTQALLDPDPVIAP